MFLNAFAPHFKNWKHVETLLIPLKLNLLVPLKSVLPTEHVHLDRVIDLIGTPSEILHCISHGCKVNDRCISYSLVLRL